MKKTALMSFTSWIIVLGCLLVCTSPCRGATYYVRTDGGTAEQCTGLSNAPYPGVGTGQPCAWAHPFWALDASGNWRITGGDTLIIYPGSYRMGLGAPNTAWCDEWGAFDCHLPALPSGPDAAHPTRILGAGWDQGCANPPELWGAERPWHILSLEGTSHAVIGCLEITDHSRCVESHADPAIRCARDTPPYGDWAAAGIYAADSFDVLLSHLNIHGLAWVGVHAGRLSNWTVDHVRIAGNGWAGWDGDIGDSANTGDLIFRNWVVEWNGCAENYPEETPCACWAQTAGGYGDGVGLAETGGFWLIEDSIFRYNTSDGLDMLYVRLDPSSIEIKRTQAYGNAGNQIKTNGPTHIENSLIVGNCGFFDGKDFTYHVDNCRAAGNALSLDVRNGNLISVINSTIVGHGDCLCLVVCGSGDCDGSETLIAQNNIFMGYPEFGNPSEQACYIWYEPTVFGAVNTDYNVVFNTKMGNVGLSAHDLNEDPLVVNSNLETFDGHLQAGSPAIDSGLPVGSLGGLVPDHDLENHPRPLGGGVDRGAYEFGEIGFSIDIQANGSDGPVAVSSGTPVSVTVGLTPAEYAGFNADWWIAVRTPFAPPGDWYTYVHPTGWRSGIHRCVQTPLFQFSDVEVLDMALPTGAYTFYFAIDPPDGIATAELLDSVAVEVTP